MCLINQQTGVISKMKKSLLLLAGVASFILVFVSAEDNVTTDAEDDVEYCEDDDNAPTCKKNEVFNSCSNGGCSARNCSQIGTPILCVKLDSKACKPGCVCADGYLRSIKGICVPRDQCDACGKDNNAKPGCGINCNRRCATYKDKGEFCIDICKIDGCDCKTGFVYDDNIKKCVKPEKCTPVCGRFEVFNSCVQGQCNPKNCSQIGTSIACPRIDPRYCIAGCLCQEGYLRATNGSCVPKDQCDACGGDSNAHPGCGNCNKLCSNYKKKDMVCIQSCDIDGCDCNDGYVYDSNTGKCVKPENCSPTCKKNEVFSTCTNGGCSARNCSQIGTPVPCVKLDSKACKPGCVCAEGYLRSINGTCVPRDQCDACGEDNNAKPGCGINCNRRCATYKNKGEFCIDICKVDGCDCKIGFVYDDNTKKCVKPEKCTPVCGKFEVFNSCVQGHCNPKNCTQIGKSIACPRIDPKYCKAGCLCQEGYFRATNGSCVPKDQCDACGGDVNAHPGSGNKCNKKCSDYNKKPTPCPKIFNENGCDCNKGYLYDQNLKKCVQPKQCTSTCKENEIYNDCVNGLCRPKNCTQRGWKIPCPPMVPGSCTGACICVDGYLRAQNGTCVLEDECDPPCPDGETLSKCPSQKCDAEYCPLTRDDPLYCKSTKKCGPPRCVCGFNQHRDRNTGKCIPTASCPPFPCDGQNEQYNKCPTICPRQNCSNYLTNSTCPRPWFRIGIVVPCQPQCRCEPNFFRNFDGKCVAADQCEAEVCPDGEVFDKCPPVKCDAENCPLSRTDPLTCPTGIVCDTPRCVCGFNEHRDRTTGKCIATASCPPFPCDGPLEHYDSCPATCPGEKCLDFISNATCSKYKIGIVVPCKPACRCDKNSYRNYNNTCIPKNKCESESCAPGEILSKCPAVKCDAENCPLTRDSPSSCPIGIVCDKPRCICGLNRRRDRDTNLCIKEADCPPFPCDGQNEEYKSCPSSCPSDTCTDYLRKPTCPVYIRAPDCKPDCRCKNNYYRDGNGTCVTSKECKKCPKEHEFWDPCPHTCPPQNCTSIGKVFSCPAELVNRTCIGSCRCGDGYYRNDNNDCISAKDCGRCLGKNEFWNPCASNCPPQNCSSIGKIYHCPFQSSDNCEGECQCIRDHYRNDNGQCISKKDCKRCTGDNEFWDPSPPWCSPQTCDSLKYPPYCPRQTKNTTAECRCIKGYYRDSNNICIPKCDCPTTENVNNDDNADDDDDGDDDDDDGDDDNDDNKNNDNNDDDNDDDDNTSTGSVYALDKYNIASTKFSMDLIKTYWNKNLGKSCILSPSSILVLLLQLLANSEDSTFSQLSAVLNLTSAKEVQLVAPVLLSSLQSQDNVTCDVANKMYCTDKYPLKESYKQYVQKYFYEAIENIDFSQSTDAAKTMNDWVANKTEGLITNLIPSSALSSSTVLVLINAIYFKAPWKIKFDPKNTEDRPFYQINNVTTQVKTMFVEDIFNYTYDETLDAQVVKLLYQNEDFNFIVILPNQKDGIDNLLDKLSDPDAYFNAINNLYPTKCKLYLPTFKTTSSLDLEQYLEAENLTAMFNPHKAKFVNITEEPEQIYVSQMIQKAFIEVTEEGSKAAAATAAVINTRALARPPSDVNVVKADHTFLYMLLKDTIITFVGIENGDRIIPTAIVTALSASIDNTVSIPIVKADRPFLSIISRKTLNIDFPIFTALYSGN